MKYIILVGDGMADYPIEALGNRTPLEVANTKNMDFIAANGKLGRVKTIPQGMSPASDVANISILGYDPLRYYTGRGPLEAANLGVELQDEDVAFRCNLVTVSGNTLVDYSAGHINNKEAHTLIKFVDEHLGDNRIRFYPGVSYRHLMIVRRGTEYGVEKVQCTPPHDIVGRQVQKYVPKGEGADFIIDLMEESRKLLQHHEINLVRLDLKENPANMIWLWGQGKKPALPTFKEKYGVSGSVISAVDLIRGLGKILGLEVIQVPGATGYYDTNYQGKAEAALVALEQKDFVFLHVEAPDEAGHNGDLREKITAIERFDELVVGRILNAYKHRDDFRLLVLPDHATPISVRTHVAEPVLFGMYGKDIVAGAFAGFNEKEAQKTDFYFDKGYELMDYLLKGELPT